jgi:hypothetical protein
VRESSYSAAEHAAEAIISQLRDWRTLAQPKASKSSLSARIRKETLSIADANFQQPFYSLASEYLSRSQDPGSGDYS